VKQKFKTTWFYAPVGYYEEVKTVGWLWNKKKVNVKNPAPQTADYDQFSEFLEKAYQSFDEDGYDVINVIPLALGASDSCYARLENGKSNYLGETGFSVTRGAIVVGKLRDDLIFQENF
jgi:uncharacterized protein (UPF0297 family)